MSKRVFVSYSCLTPGLNLRLRNTIIEIEDEIKYPYDINKIETDLEKKYKGYEWEIRVINWKDLSNDF